jgi:hypothetical protein
MDLIPLPNFGEILQSLLPDDRVHTDQYYRGVGTAMMFLGIIGLLLFLTIATFTTPTFMVPIYIVVGLIIVGIAIQVAAYLAEKENREIGKDRKQSEANGATADGDTDQIMSEVINDQDHKRLTIQERIETMESPSSDEVADRRDRTVTIEPATEESREEKSEGKESAEDEENTRELEHEE